MDKRGLLTMIPVLMLVAVFPGAGPFPSFLDVFSESMRGGYGPHADVDQGQNSYGGQSFEQVLKKTGCASRFWTEGEEGDIGALEYVTGLEEHQLRSWAWEAEERGYYEAGLFSGRSTAKAYQYINSLTKSECVPVLRNIGIPEDQITTGDGGD